MHGRFGKQARARHTGRQKATSPCPTVSHDGPPSMPRLREQRSALRHFRTSNTVPVPRIEFTRQVEANSLHQRGIGSLGQPMNSGATRQLLEWCLEIGADECIGETPVDRFKLELRNANRMQKNTPPSRPEPQHQDKVDHGLAQQDAVSEARESAERAANLESLRSAIAAFGHCELSRLAQNLVFSDGNPSARVMIIGEAPGAEEDRLGKPFVGRAGRLLDRMFEQIGLGRDQATPETALYISNILPWRPPGNRNPTRDEIEMMSPFVFRHIELIDPRVLVLMGNISCSALIGRSGITRMRGTWHELRGIAVMPMFHPAYLLRNPVAKGDAWVDLLRIREVSCGTVDQ